MSGENIKVAVRLRNFSSRELELKSKCVVEMSGNQTILKSKTQNNSSNNTENDRLFAFDYSYWSFDGNILILENRIKKKNLSI